MLETIKHRYRLSKLFCEKRRLQNACAARIREAGNKVGASEATAELISEAAFEQGLVEDSINWLVTGQLLRQADRLFVPVPDYEDQKMWAETTGDDRRVLTPLGISTLRAAVRAELGQRRESLLKLLAALTGIIGAATGFIAVWLKRH
jgi:hypothetical protein